MASRHASLQRRANLASARASRTPGIRVEGLRELMAAFKSLPDGVYQQIRATFRTAALVAAERANALAPVDTSGAKSPEPPLSDSYRVRAGRTGALVGSPLLKAPIINFGRKARHDGHGHKNPHVRRLTPRPHLIEAVEQVKPGLEGRIRSELQSTLDRVFDTGFRAP